MTGPPRGPAILIPAAGRSARMRGRDKLFEPVRGRPLLVDRVGAGTACASDVFVTLPPPHVAPARWRALAETAAETVAVADHDSGLSASFRAGIAALPPACPGLMILPADMPDITVDDIATLLDRFDGRAILRGASSDGRPGHPVLFPACDFAALAALAGDQGGRKILDVARNRVIHVPLPAYHALTDLDTPEDWDRWHSRQM